MSVELAPILDRVRDEFWPVVHPDERGRPITFERKAVKDFDDVVGVDRVIDLDRKGLAAELVDDVEHFESAAVGEGVELEVHRRD